MIDAVVMRGALVEDGATARIHAGIRSMTRLSGVSSPRGRARRDANPRTRRPRSMAELVNLADVFPTRPVVEVAGEAQTRGAGAYST